MVKVDVLERPDVKQIFLLENLESLVPLEFCLLVHLECFYWRDVTLHTRQELCLSDIAVELNFTKLHLTDSDHKEAGQLLDVVEADCIFGLPLDLSQEVQVLSIDIQLPVFTEEHQYSVCLGVCAIYYRFGLPWD